MRALSRVMLAAALCAGIAAPAEAGKSRSIGGTSVVISTPHATFGWGQGSFHRHERGSGAFLHHRKHRFFDHPLPRSSAIVPPLTGPIVPPFQIGRPSHRDLFFRRKHGFDGFFWSGSAGRSQTIIILQQFAVPVAVPEPAAPPVKAQVVEIQPWSETDEVLILSPSKNGQ